MSSPAEGQGRRRSRRSGPPTSLNRRLQSTARTRDSPTPPPSVGEALEFRGLHPLGLLQYCTDDREEVVRAVAINFTKKLPSNPLSPLSLGGEGRKKPLSNAGP